MAGPENGGRSSTLRLVWSNGAAGTVTYGLTPLDLQVATAIRDQTPALPRSPLHGTVFLSHSHKDNAFCRFLDRDLRERGLQTWFDLKDLPGGRSIPEKINFGMQNSNFVVVVYTHNSAASDWVKLEYNTAIALGTNEELDSLIVVKHRRCKATAHSRTQGLHRLPR